MNVNLDTFPDSEETYLKEKLKQENEGKMGRAVELLPVVISETGRVIAVFKGFNLGQPCRTRSVSRSHVAAMTGMFQRGLAVIISHLMLCYS